MVLVLSRFSFAECHEVFASLSNIFESSKFFLGFSSHFPASVETFAISESPYQIRSSEEHDSFSVIGHVTF